MQLRPSAALGAALALAHLFVAGAIMAIGAAWEWTAATASLLTLSLIFNLRRHVFHQPVRRLTLLADGAMEAHLEDGSRRVSVLPETTVLDGLVVLQLKEGSRTLALALPRDALGADAHRQLRVWLRWKASGAAA